ncbi:efflux transporter outer membrane subunit [Neisseriaceae bacterium TC5R-5]|nr:efflux transporter outer membrane subunit [Neisseriaceae bacterium TC5R-5]
MLKRALLPLLITLALSACAVGPDYHRPLLELPEASAAQASSEALLVKDWWQQFKDPILTQLIDEALQHNQDLLTAAARVDEAAAQAGIARAQLLPTLDANAAYQRGRSSSEIVTPGTPLVADTRNANLQVAWELDLWGKLRRSNEAARANFAATRFARDASQLSIAAQVAQTYFQLRAYDAQLEIAQRTLATRQETLTLQNKRFARGAISALDQAQAEADEAATRATVPQIANARAQTATALNILVGRSAKTMVEGELPRGGNIDQLLVPTSIPADLSSTLLARRPDVAASEQQLIAANAQIGVARAAYFPTISLTGALGSQSTSLDGLFSGPARTWSFVGNAAAPIFNFGQTGYNVDAATARQKQALAGYEKTVQSAFKDALDALSAQNSSRDILQAQTVQSSALSKSLKLATLRYDKGYSSYLEVLDAQRGSFQAELNVVSAKLNQLNAAVGLYKALGGGWVQ